MKNIYNNKITFRVFLIFLIFIFGKNGISQTAITGKVTDTETGEEMISANIIVARNGVFIQGETTDVDGNYNIRIDPGTFDMEISYTGYATQKIAGIVVVKGKATKVNAQLKSGGEIIWFGGCGGWTIPLIRQDENPNKLKITSEKIRYLPTRNINEIITITPGVSFTQ